MNRFIPNQVSRRAKPEVTNSASESHKCACSMGHTMRKIRVLSYREVFFLLHALVAARLVSRMRITARSTPRMRVNFDSYARQLHLDKQHYRVEFNSFCHCSVPDVTTDLTTTSTKMKTFEYYQLLRDYTSNGFFTPVFPGWSEVKCVVLLPTL